VEHVQADDSNLYVYLPECSKYTREERDKLHVYKKRKHYSIVLRNAEIASKVIQNIM